MICHNSNCAEPTDPENDDSIEALDESLALVQDGRPIIDGTEIDLFWRASDSQCIFAHDLASARTELATTTAQVLADHLATPGPVTFGDGPFQLFIELKAFVGVEKSQRHTPEQRMLHAACMWEFYKTVTDAAIANGRDMKVFIASFSPELLAEVIRQTPAAVPFPPGYEAFYGVPRPLDSETRPLSDYAGLPIQYVEMHSQWIIDSQYEGLISSGIHIGFFMFSATEEHFAAIEQYEPEWVNTSEARLMRRWLER